MTLRSSVSGITLVAGVLLLGGPHEAIAHCDTLDGPVVKDARASTAKAKERPSPASRRWGL